jgi:hypothetical protein
MTHPKKLRFRGQNLFLMGITKQLEAAIGVWLATLTKSIQANKHKT